MRVSAHAIQRYRERVADMPDDQIIVALSGRAFLACAAIGRGAVILPSGHRAVVQAGTVVTVLPHRAHVSFGGTHES